MAPNEYDTRKAVSLHAPHPVDAFAFPGVLMVCRQYPLHESTLSFLAQPPVAREVVYLETSSGALTTAAAVLVQMYYPAAYLPYPASAALTQKNVSS